MRAAHHVAMILDELLTNLGNPRRGRRRARDGFHFGRTRQRVHVELSTAAPPFDPRSAPEPDLSGPPKTERSGAWACF